ncbi:uncharacterized protein [Nicotiana tomentosiformis]|uniref:uncharacterized protein n=1 Tax=Nicotiana tomentosiformis TaxID=4098 RepID=UPI00388CC140
MSVTQYEMRFSELASHAIWLIPTDMERIRRFIDGLTFQLRLLVTRERVSGATFDEVVEIAHQIEMVRSQKRVEREAKRPRGSGDFSDVPSGAQHMVDKGCLAYLAYVRDTIAGTLAIDSVPVVWEFPDVFPSDLPGMPPDRDISFYNDLAPGTQPISIPQYHMAPKELKELKEQLEELLAKGFVRPSVSP